MAAPDDNETQGPLPHMERDAHGMPRARTDGGCALLADFLEGDIQSDIGRCREIIDAVNAVINGSIPRFQVTGNAHTLTIDSRQAQIESEFDEDAEPCILAPQRLRQALLQWLELLLRE